MAVLPKKLELFFRSFLCCLCCGLEGTGHNTNSTCDSTYYNSHAFLTLKDILKLFLPFIFSVFSFVCVFLYFFYPLYIDKLVFAQLSFLAFLCLVSSTYTCRYIYTFHTNVAKKNILLVTSKYTCLQKWLSLSLIIFSSFIFLIDLWGYMNPYKRKSSIIITSIEEKSSSSSMQKCSLIQVLFWEGFSIFWSTIWYILVLKSSTYLRKRQHIIRALEISAGTSRGLFIEGGYNGNLVNRNELVNTMNNNLHIDGTVYKEENVDYKKLHTIQDPPIFESTITDNNNIQHNNIIHPVTIGIPVDMRIQESSIQSNNNSNMNNNNDINNNDANNNNNNNNNINNNTNNNNNIYTQSHPNINII